MKNVKEFLKSNKDLKTKISQMIRTSQEKGLIKPHTEAFKEFPVKYEIHKGKKSYFCN